MERSKKTELPKHLVPMHWYNIIPDLPKPLPMPRDEEALKRISKAMIADCLSQEFSKERLVQIPEELLEIYKQIGRPRPLIRAKNLEKYLGLGKKIELWFKLEGESPTGSHKLNTAVAQAFFAKKAGVKRLTTETGAGQWGTALACAAKLQGLKATVYWVRNVYDWKPERRKFMEFFGAEVFASPSQRTEAGKKFPEDHPGSLAIAISEGLEDALNDSEAKYSLGSVLNHVLLQQTIIGRETILQLQAINRYPPDYMIACFGGGSNFGGFCLPMIGHILLCEVDYSTYLRAYPFKFPKFIAVQSIVAPNLIAGVYKYDRGDHAELTPELMMYTLGHQTEMAPIKADGLRYHAAAPIISLLRNLGYIEAVSYPADEKEVFEKAKIFIEAEGFPANTKASQRNIKEALERAKGFMEIITRANDVQEMFDLSRKFIWEKVFIPAPESAYAIAHAIDKALECKREGKRAIIVANISGHGFLDLPAYYEKLGI